MLGAGGPPVKPGNAGLPTICRRRRQAADCPPRLRASRVTAFSFPVVSAVLTVVIVIGLGLVWWLSRRTDPRQRAVTELLDAADALEARLRTARAEIESITGDEDDTVRTALQEMLRQRLWLQQHGATASLRTLKDMRSSLDQDRHRIDQQLVLVQQARSPQA